MSAFTLTEVCDSSEESACKQRSLGEPVHGSSDVPIRGGAEQLDDVALAFRDVSEELHPVEFIGDVLERCRHYWVRLSFG